MANNEVFKNTSNAGYVDATLVLGLYAAANLPANFSSSSIITKVVCTTPVGVGAGNARFKVVVPALTAVGANTPQLIGAGSVATDLSTYRIYYSN